MLKGANLTCQGKMLTVCEDETSRGIGAYIKWLVIFLILYSESLGANVLCMCICIWSNSRPELWVPSSLCIRKSSVFFKYSGFLEPETLTSMGFSVLTGSLLNEICKISLSPWQSFNLGF